MKVVFSKGTLKNVELFEGINDKVIADGVGGELVPLIAAQGMTWPTYVTKGNQAIAHEKEHFRLFNLGEINNALAYKEIAKVNLVSRDIYQELKDLNAPNFENSSAWGFDVGPNGALNFPTDIAGEILLWENIRDKHSTYAPGTSPIQGLITAKTYNMVLIDSIRQIAKDAKIAADQNYRDAKLETAYKNEKMAPGTIAAHQVAAFLQHRHSDNGRLLGLYKFNTSDAPSVETEQVSSIPIEGQKVIQHIVFDSMLVSLVDFDMMVHAGPDDSSPGELLTAYGELAMKKGHSQVCIVSTNLTKEGKVKEIVWR